MTCFGVSYGINVYVLMVMCSTSYWVVGTKLHYPRLCFCCCLLLRGAGLQKCSEHFLKGCKTPVSFVVYVPSCVLNTKSKNVIHVLPKVPLCTLGMACGTTEDSVLKGP
jgi:hypothetical protein